MICENHATRTEDLAGMALDAATEVDRATRLADSGLKAATAILGSVRKFCEATRGSSGILEYDPAMVVTYNAALVDGYSVRSNTVSELVTALEAMLDSAGESLIRRDLAGLGSLMGFCLSIHDQWLRSGH